MALRDNPAAVPVILQHPIYPVVTLDTDWPSMRDFAEGHLLDRVGNGLFQRRPSPQCPAIIASQPLNFDQTGMPPSLVTTASLDPLRDQGHCLCRAAESRRRARRASQRRGQYPRPYQRLRKGIPSTQDDIEGNISALERNARRDYGRAYEQTSTIYRIGRAPGSCSRTRTVRSLSANESTAPEGDAWQMPQGGIDEGEDRTRSRLARADRGNRRFAELVDIIAECARGHYYDLPPK